VLCKILTSDSGEPVTLYHGGLEWDDFDPKASGREALWLTPEVSVASGFADQYSPREGREIKAFHVAISKLLDLTDAAVVEAVFGEDDAPDPHVLARDRSLIEKAIVFAKAHGYDGLVHPDSDVFNRYSNGRVSYAVFSKDQLFLAPLTGLEEDGNTYGIPLRGSVEDAIADRQRGQSS
jgi:hypothetical protein